MHGQRHAAFRCPLCDLVIAGLFRLAGFVVIVHRPRHALSEAAEAQHLIAETRRQHACETLKFLNFGTGSLAVEAVGDAHRHLSLLPYSEHGLVVRWGQIVAAGVTDTGQSQTIQFSEKFFRAIDLLLECRFRKPIEQSHDAGLVSGDASGEVAGGVALQSCAGRKVRVAGDFQCVEAGARHQDPGIVELHVDRVVRRGHFEFRLGRPPLLSELVWAPTASNNEPCAWLHRSCRLTDAVQCLSNSRRADPVYFGAEGEAGPNRVKVRVNQTGDNGASFKIDNSCSRTGDFAYVRCGPGRQYPSVVNCQRFADGELCIDGENLSVDENGIGHLAPRGHRKNAEDDDRRSEVSHSLSLDRMLPVALEELYRALVTFRGLAGLERSEVASLSSRAILLP